MDLLTQLVDLERQFWTAGAEFYRAKLAADFVLLIPGAGMLDREATIRGVEEGRRWASVEIVEPTLVPLGRDAVALAYSARVTRAGLPEPYTAVVGSVYVEEDGRWRLGFHQQSPT